MMKLSRLIPVLLVSFTNTASALWSSFPDSSPNAASLIMYPGAIYAKFQPVIIGNTITGSFCNDSLEEATQNAETMKAGIVKAFENARIPTGKAEVFKPTDGLCSGYAAAAGYRVAFTPPSGYIVSFARPFPDTGYYSSDVVLPDMEKFNFFADMLTRSGLRPIGAVALKIGTQRNFKLFHLTTLDRGVPISLNESGNYPRNLETLTSKPDETYQSYLKNNRMIVYNYDEGLLPRLVYLGPLIIQTVSDPVLKKDAAALIKMLDAKYGPRTIVKEISVEGAYTEVVYYYLPPIYSEYELNGYSWLNFCPE